MAVNASGSQVIQEKIHAQEDSDSDFQSAFNYAPSSKEKTTGNSKKAAKAKKNKHKEEVSHTPAMPEQEQGLKLKDLYAADTTASVMKGINNQEKKASKTVQKKTYKKVALRIAKGEAQRSSTKLMKSLTCGGIDYARSSSSKCPYHVKSKAEVHQEFTK